MRTRTAALAFAQNPQNETLVHATFSRVSSIPNTNAALAARTFGTTILSEQAARGGADTATAAKADSK
jgi:hypothetical protein